MNRKTLITIAIIIIVILIAVGAYAAGVNQGRLTASPSPSPTVVVTVSPAASPSPTPAVTVTPSPTPQTQTIQVFFSNQREGGNNCQAVFPVIRTINRTETIGRAALEELLKGPTQKEISQGFNTNIPVNTRIQNLTIQNGVARVDFNQALDQGVGGSCRAAAIRAQITQTLLQFPTVDRVIISINGNTSGILQP